MEVVVDTKNASSSRPLESPPFALVPRLSTSTSACSCTYTSPSAVFDTLTIAFVLSYAF